MQNSLSVYVTDPYISHRIYPHTSLLTSTVAISRRSKCFIYLWASVCCFSLPSLLPLAIVAVISYLAGILEHLLNRSHAKADQSPWEQLMAPNSVTDKTSASSRDLPHPHKSNRKVLAGPGLPCAQTLPARVRQGRSRSAAHCSALLCQWSKWRQDSPDGQCHSSCLRIQNGSLLYIILIHLINSLTIKI